VFDPEGISYLDMADAYRRGDWQAALVGAWSPLYSWLLALMMVLVNPTAQWEFTAVHALDFLVYLLALASFGIFLSALLRFNEKRGTNQQVPDWAWIVLGYSLFTWATVRLMPPYLPEPDAIVAVWVFLIFTILLRIRTDTLTWGRAILLGILLAVGYVTKAIMLPMGFVFAGVAAVLAGRQRPNIYKSIAAFAVFLLLSAPYAFVLSKANGRWMFSDIGRLNYMWEINQIQRPNEVKHWSHWQGEEQEGLRGTPVHPTRKIHDDPPMYEFATPYRVTYPPWYDPSYWYEGVEIRVDLRRQLSVIIRNVTGALSFFANAPGPLVPTQRAYYSIDDTLETTLGALLTLSCFLGLTNLGRVSAVPAGIARYWFALVPIVAVLGAYALLHLEGRYIAPYVVILWLVLFRLLGVPHSEDSARLFTRVVVLAAILTVATTAVGTGQALLTSARQLLAGKTQVPLVQSGYTNWKVATYLHRAGVREGDNVGSVGWTYTAYWARMGRLHVIAEIPAEGARAFWSLDASGRAPLLQLFRGVGAKAVVASLPAGPAPADWQQVEGTNYWVYLLSGKGAGK
jgi:hypothetical protein